MKKLFFCISILSFLVTCKAQERLQPLGSRKSGIQIPGKLVVDSAFRLPTLRPLTAQIAPGYLMYQTSDSSLYSWTGYQWLKQAGGGGGGTTNLGRSLTANDITLTNDNGTAVIIPSSDGTNAGLVPAIKFNEWNNKLSVLNIGATQGAGSVAITSSAGTSGTINPVDATKAGVVTPTMKTSWDSKIASVSVANSVTGNGNNTALSLIGDVNAPGNDVFYGTNATGQKGWWTPPGGPGGSSASVNTSLAALDASSALATDKIYWITDSLKQGPFQYVGTVANQTSDNGATIIVNAGLQQFKRIYSGDIDARWFGCTADGTSKASPGSGDARNLLRAIAAAGKEQKVFLPAYNSGWYYIDTTVTLYGGQFQLGGLNRNVELTGNFYVASGITGFIVDGFKHHFQHVGQLISTQTATAADSASYAAYTGTGVYVRNCDKCVVSLDRVLDFKYNLRIGGESDTAHLGTQYSTITAKHIYHGYIQAWITVAGTTTDGGSNWCNSNTISLTETGGGLVPAAGGTYGIKFEKVNGNSTSKFETNDIYSHGFEGCQYGLYAQFAKNNNFFGGRIEDAAVTNRLYFQYSNTGNLSAPDNNIYGIYMYEGYFIPGGLADGTTVYGVVYTASTSRAGFLSIAYNQRFTHFANNDNATAFAETSGDIIAFNNLDGNAPDRYLIRAKINGKEYFVPYESGDTLTTAASFTVPNGYNTVWINRPSGVATETLPSASAWPKREILFKNIEVTQNVTIAGAASGEISSVSAGQAVKYRSNGTVWYVVGNTASGGGGGGSFSLGGFGSTPSASGGSYNSGTGVYNNQPADSTHPGSISIGNQIFQGGKQFDSISTDVVSLYKNGSGFNKIDWTLRKNGFSINDNGTPNANSTTLTAYNFGSGSSSKDILFGFGKTGVNWVGMGNDGTDMIFVTEKTTGGFEFRKAVTYAGASLQAGTPLGKFFGTSGNFLVGGAMVDSGYKMDVKGSLRTLGVVTMRDLLGADTRMVVVNADGTLDAQTIPSGGTGGSSIFSTGAGTGSPYYHNSGSVNIGINPPQSYAWTHWGASTATRAIWEFASTSIAPSAPRNHSMWYEGASGELHLYSNNTDQTVLTSTTFAPFTGYYQGSPIGLGYLDAGASLVGSPVVSDGSGGAKIALAPIIVTYTQTSPVSFTGTTAASIWGGPHTGMPVLTIGSSVIFEGSGQLSITNAGTATFRLTFGSSTSTYVSPAFGAGTKLYNYKIYYKTTPITTGTSANSTGHYEISIYNLTDGVELAHIVQPTTQTAGLINTSAPSMTATIQFSASGNTVNTTDNTIEVKRQN